jgi:hypothetical protein
MYFWVHEDCEYRIVQTRNDAYLLNARVRSQLCRGLSTVRQEPAAGSATGLLGREERRLFEPRALALPSKTVGAALRKHSRYERYRA